MSAQPARFTMLACCAVFFALGVINASFGPALPELAQHTASDLAQIGGLFTAYFVGALLSQVLAGPLVDRLGQRPVLVAGMAVTACGVLATAFAPALPLLLACAALTGFGFGATGVAVNVLVSATFATRRAAALNLVNVFFGLGSFVGPALAGATLRFGDTALPPLGLGALLMGAVIVPLAGMRLGKPTATAVASGPSIYRSPPLWAVGALFVLSVGCESGMGAWTSTYAARTVALDAATAAFVTSAYWLALTLGRVIGAAIGTRLPAATLLRACLIGAALGAGMLLATVGNLLLTLAAIALIGLCFGPIFPTAFAQISTRYQRAAGAAAGVVIPMGSVGGAIIPLLQGNLLASYGPVAVMRVIAIGTLGMIALEAISRTLDTHAPRRSAVADALEQTE